MPEFLQQKKMPESIFFKAENGTRTHDPFITSEVIYQLSYFSRNTTKIIILGKRKKSNHKFYVNRNYLIPVFFL